jgi:hypothetical protein
MGVDHNDIKELFLKDSFIISNHARVRMFQRNISTDDIRRIIERGEIIEDYPEDEPCPAALLLGFTEERPCHCSNSSMRRSCQSDNCLYSRKR